MVALSLTAHSSNAAFDSSDVAALAAAPQAPHPLTGGADIRSACQGGRPCSILKLMAVPD
jgi:hypothetical protein